MADTPEFTQANLTAINAAIATGARECWYGDKRVAYRSLDEMIRIRDLIKENLGLKEENTTRVFASFKKGFN
jgi:hypothetical protein